jgi:competence ComEA-like helix-hairpin-helix protein
MEQSGRLEPSRRRLLLGVWALWTCVQLVGLVAREVDALARPRSCVLGPYCMDVDRARIAELRLLPGIGPELAAAIVLERVRGGPFGAVEELARVPGIGPALVARVRSCVGDGKKGDG